MKVYLTTGKTVTGGWRVSEKTVREWVTEEGVVFVQPRALEDGTVAPEDFPATVELIPSEDPPPGTIVLAPAPRGWVGGPAVGGGGMYILITEGEILAFPNLKTLLLKMNAVLGDAKVSLDGPYRLRVRSPKKTLRVIRLNPFVEALEALEDQRVSFTLYPVLTGEEGLTLLLDMDWWHPRAGGITAYAMAYLPPEVLEKAQELAKAHP